MTIPAFPRIKTTDRLLTVIAGILFLLSCEEIMEGDFSGDSTRNLVVEGAITTDLKSHGVTLSYTGDFFQKTEKEMATGAEVSITDGENVFILTEESAGEYVTESNVQGETGKSYTLTIKLSDGREFTGTDQLRPCGDIDSIRQSPNFNSFLNGYGYDVLFYGREPEPAGDYYLYLLYINNKLYTDTITEVSFVSDEFVNGNYIRDLPIYRIREAEVIPVPVEVTLEMHSITKQYYDFLSSLMVETVWRGSPWDGPPANVPGNISNGATGFFRASEIKRKFRFFAPLPRVN